MRTIQFRRVSHALVDTRFECGLRLLKALRACEWFECRTRFECSLPNQGGIMSHHYMIAGNNTVQPSVARTRVHALVYTRFKCGLRLHKALRACEWFECRTRFECSLPNQGG